MWYVNARMEMGWYVNFGLFKKFTEYKHAILKYHYSKYTVDK
jgi:hypothetical protein